MIQTSTYKLKGRSSLKLIPFSLIKRQKKKKIFVLVKFKDKTKKDDRAERTWITDLGLVSLSEEEPGWLLCFFEVTVMPGLRELRARP